MQSKRWLQRTVYDWSSYYWASCVLLAQLTDGGTYHERSQHFMKMWVCGIDKARPCPSLGSAHGASVLV